MSKFQEELDIKFSILDNHYAYDDKQFQIELISVAPGHRNNDNKPMIGRRNVTTVTIVDDDGMRLFVFQS